MQPPFSWGVGVDPVVLPERTMSAHPAVGLGYPPRMLAQKPQKIG